MKNRVAWGLAVVLAVLLLGGVGVLIQHTYTVSPAFAWNYWSFGYFDVPGEFRGVSLGPVWVMWWHK
jgi:hypothetical protein